MKGVWGANPPAVTGYHDTITIAITTSTATITSITIIITSAFHVVNTQARTASAAVRSRTSLPHCWRMAALRALLSHNMILKTAVQRALSFSSASWRHCLQIDVRQTSRRRRRDVSTTPQQRLHSLRWGWMLNVPKSIVMVFETQSLCARLGARDRWWGDSRLPTADTVKNLGLRLESCGGWAAQQAAGAANGWAALHRWLPVLRSRHLSAGTKLFVLRSPIAPFMSYGMELWRPSKRGANMTAVLVRAAKLIRGIYRDASHTAFFQKPFSQPGCDACRS